MYPRFGLCIMFLCVSLGNAAVYQTSEEFLQEIFGGAIPARKTLWITKPIKRKATKILSHRIGFLRTRYWETDGGTVWILEEIGKTKPITVGVTVINGRIGKIKVLAFRESRGWEVKQEFFTEQFFQAGLNQHLKLDKDIDGISGATLSVRALKKIARLALLFDKSLNR